MYALLSMFIQSYSLLSIALSSIVINSYPLHPFLSTFITYGWVKTKIEKAIFFYELDQTGWIESCTNIISQLSGSWNWAWLGILSEPLEIKRQNRSAFECRQKYKKIENVLEVKIDCISRGFGVTLLITWPQWRHRIWKMNGLKHNFRDL